MARGEEFIPPDTQLLTKIQEEVTRTRELMEIAVEKMSWPPIILNELKGLRLDVANYTGNPPKEVNASQEE